MYDAADLAVTGVNYLRGRASGTELSVTAAGAGAGLIGIGGGFGKAARAALSAAGDGVGALKGTRYTSKVIQDIAKGDFHSFPLEVDNFVGQGTVSAIRGGDGIVRQRVSLRGSWRGQEGTFEWIVDPDKSINHRLWVPDKR